jgi:hypothetical protein
MDDPGAEEWNYDGFKVDKDQDKSRMVLKELYEEVATR